MFLLTVFFRNEIIAQQSVVKLWNESIPGAKVSASYQEELIKNNEGEPASVSMVTDPSITVFLPQNHDGLVPAVIICPGGGYKYLTMNKEGYQVAQWFNKLGIAAFVLKSRLPSDEIMENRSIGPLQDAQEAVRFVRRNAAKYGIDSHKVGVMGFSAGGHLAASVSTLYGEKVYESGDSISARPDFSMLIYPVISMDEKVTHRGSRENLLGKSPAAELLDRFSVDKQIGKETPPAFIVHASDDKAVPVENSLLYYRALIASKVPAEMHIYEKGGHGFGLGRDTFTDKWPEALKDWLVNNRILSL